MASSTQRQTAKIYQFPARPGIAASKLRNLAADDRLMVSDYADCASSGAWYHDAAIAERDVRPAPKRS